MALARARRYQPMHARPAPRSRRRYGGLVVLALYAAALGLNEWRIQRHVEQVRARQQTVVELDDAPPVEIVPDGSR